MQEQKASHPALGHLRANLWLLVLSLVICCVLYPAAVWAFGWVFFHNAAEGSLIDKEGKPTTDPSNAVGSKLVAQPFNSPVFFQPRPSATSPSAYNAAASGGSNYSASNPKLRGRVAQQLGPIVRYTKAYIARRLKADGSEPNPQDDLKDWFKAQTDAKRDLFTEWATNNSTIAQAWATGGWVTGGAWTKDYILDWVNKHPDGVAAWKKDNPDATQAPGADALVAYFFASYEKEFFGKWPTAEAPGDVKARIAAWAKGHPDVTAKWKAANPDAKDEPTDDDLAAFFYQDFATNPKDWPPLEPGEFVDGDQKAVVKPDAQDSDVESTFFDTWLTEQVQAKKLDPVKDFDQVPADMVMTSGSGLDPDISAANARYQENAVVGANRDAIIGDYEKANNAKATDAQKAKVEADVKKAADGLLDELAYRPMFGLTGDEPIVNVLQLNLRLKAEAAKVKVQ